MSIALDQLRKRYGRHLVVNDVSLEVRAGEFFVLLDGRDVSALPPQRRPVGLVFENCAPFCNMTAAENAEFPLAIRGVAPAERRRRRDEPFGALDAKIRAELRRTIREVHDELGVTTIFVTHDQEEAFELGDRIGVINFSRLLEVGPPHELYLHPHTEFVATFLGTANLMVGETTGDGLRLGPLSFSLATRPRGSFESQRGLESGAIDYLTKPFSMRMLVAKVRALLSRPA